MMNDKDLREFHSIGKRKLFGMESQNLIIKLLKESTLNQVEFMTSITKNYHLLQRY